jgi:hypothetical protein
VNKKNIKISYSKKKKRINENNVENYKDENDDNNNDYSHKINYNKKIININNENK